MDDSDKVTVVMTVGQVKKMFGESVIDKVDRKNDSEIQEKIDDRLPREMQDWK